MQPHLDATQPRLVRVFQAVFIQIGPDQIAEAQIGTGLDGEDQRDGAAASAGVHGAEGEGLGTGGCRGAGKDAGGALEGQPGRQGACGDRPYIGRSASGSRETLAESCADRGGREAAGADGQRREDTARGEDVVTLSAGTIAGSRPDAERIIVCGRGRRAGEGARDHPRRGIQREARRQAAAGHGPCVRAGASRGAECHLIRHCGICHRQCGGRDRDEGRRPHKDAIAAADCRAVGIRHRDCNWCCSARGGGAADHP